MIGGPVGGEEVGDGFGAGGEEGAAGGFEAGEGLVAAGDEPAVHAEFGGDVGIVNGVADEEGLGGVEAEGVEGAFALGDFAGGVVIGVSVEVVEEVAEAVFGDESDEGVVLVGGEDALVESGVGDLLEAGVSVGIEVGFAAAGFVAADEFHAEDFEGFAGEVEADAFVVAIDGEVEDVLVVGFGHFRHRSGAEHGVHDIAAEPGVVEEGSVPVPEDVSDGVGWWGVCFVNHG